MVKGAMEDARPVPYTPLTHEELGELRYAKGLLENPGFTARISSVLGSPIEKGLRMLPPGWNEHLNKAVRQALFKALQVAVASLGEKPPRKSSDWMHKVLVGASGTVGGAFGLASVAFELPISTAIMLRSIADIARSEGFDIAAVETKLNCLEVFALGGRRKEDDAAESSYWAVRAALGQAVSEAAAHISRRGVVERTAPAIARLLSAVASRFGVVVSEQAAAKAIPVIGAATGAVINILFIDHFQDMARGHFIIKRLEAKYGQGTVESAYTQLAANPAP
ncbi:MAG TPA: EcsC family protein [Verrucomicrobiae bacterium]|nr:EcsC family protein [Verrucomicrobiae bacterium]